MSDHYRHREHYLEGSPEHGADHSSRRVQRSGAYQHATTHPFHQTYQHTSQQPTQHWRPINQQMQHFAQDLDDAPVEYSDGDQEEYADEDPEGYADEHPEAYLEEGLEEYSNVDAVEYSDEYPEEYSDEDPVEYPIDPALESLAEDSIVQSIEDPNLRFHQVSDAQQPQGSYHTVGTVQATEAFESLGLTASSSLGAQPYARGPAAVWGGGAERPPYDRAVSTPYGPVAQNLTGFERRGFEPPYLPADDWWLRMSVANDHRLNKVAATLNRSVESVVNYIEEHQLWWTPLQDHELRTKNVSQHPVTSEVMRYLDGCGNRLEDEVQARAKRLALLDKPAQRLTQVDTFQPDSQQYPLGTPGGQPIPHRAEQEVATETRRAVAGMKPSKWTPEDIRRLREWVTLHGSKWAGAELWFPGRTQNAIKKKWVEIKDKEVDQPLIDNEPGKLENLTQEDLEFIKLKLAQGHIFAVIVRVHYRAFRIRTIIKFVYFSAWRPWTRQQDQKLLDLHGQQGPRWAQISSRLPDSRRNEQEVEARFEYLRRIEIGELPPRTRAAPYSFDDEDDRYIMLRVALGMSWTQMCMEEFPDLRSVVVASHGREIGADWSADDDRWLWGQNLGPGVSPDWHSIGQTFNPPREARLVQVRWNFLQTKDPKKSRRRR